MIEARLRVYLDENIDVRVAPALRSRGWNVETTVEAGLLGRPDEVQLEHAAASGRVILTSNRRHFRRLQFDFVAARRRHAGIVLVPQGESLERAAIRAAMLLEWLASLGGAEPRLVNWNDLQVRLHRGERMPGYSEAEVKLALGLLEEA